MRRKRPNGQSWPRAFSDRRIALLTTKEIEELMIEGYKEAADPNRQLAEEWLPLTLEVWPEWEGPLPKRTRR